MEKLSDFLRRLGTEKSASALYPVLFVGHGSPMNAIEDNAYSRAWRQIGQSLPRPGTILVISAHWQTRGTWITAMENPKTIHDFYGFPEEMYRQQYPAPGAPALAGQVASFSEGAIQLDHTWGFDHGAWSVLKPMFGNADIPVLQLSLDATKPPEYHFEMAKMLGRLRNQGVLIIGSGNIVHNLSLMKFSGEAYDWAIEFDEKVKSQIEKGDFDPLVQYEKLGYPAKMSIPTNEHYLPMLYSLALADPNSEMFFFNESMAMGSVSMRSFISG